uniref:Eukaryotic translation initiation factor 3 subunit G n=1 Tax=Corethron hystrix TaxID=216773 RepID=A0A6U5KZ42_9STRA|mmetsp:Transcript_42279/g.99189  ORF Transcript_42279/g.99189 Transcript_42279/m.99189 type:complete len:348 (+) Transcript_42279:60-1103(+)|eukprot:CAMPEP_0113306228 /NCGR_PEP_ID=MMETSP0010_2-20120614/5560_1 /TAXON_ID=216773 ORGANISM="Corethron hystrix, Strain 308" /NCGR_SAMPLE_ID=MMETSP0010_2 /ASSEMBLY_ACC=CAM_ASM_000155 /LENGTH=347 /DNA_ID=CAMNT_0000160847 /DNA_START=57 /DNA_END=1100 /DNA_ORIENTATION=+ /assembly_acc=CAM_ASM_000155
MAPMSTNRWADQDDDDSSTSSTSSLPPANSKLLPPSKSSGPDGKGIKTVISWRRDDAGRRVRLTTRVRVSTSTVRHPKTRLARRHWVRNKFGAAASCEDESNVTIRSMDEVRIEDPNADVDLQDEDPSKALAGNLNAFWQKQKERHLKRQYGVDGDDAANAQELQDQKDAAEGWSKVGSAAAGGGKYVPPSMRGTSGGGGKSLADMAERAGVTGDEGGKDGGARRFDDRDQNTIRVTNISEDTTEADLQDLFQPFGRISRVYLAKDRETLVSRGFAFISFVHHDDASRSMEKLQGYGYDHLILKLEWAKPSAQKDPGSEGTQFRSGYGKALAQDTKQKVSYASNLTR